MIVYHQLISKKTSPLYLRKCLFGQEDELAVHSDKEFVDPKLETNIFCFEP